MDKERYLNYIDYDQLKQDMADGAPLESVIRKAVNETLKVVEGELTTGFFEKETESLIHDYEGKNLVIIIKDQNVPLNLETTIYKAVQNIRNRFGNNIAIVPLSAVAAVIKDVDQDKMDIYDAYAIAKDDRILKQILED